MNLSEQADLVELLAAEMQVGDPDVDRPKPHNIKYQEGWRPHLNPVQQIAVDDPAIYKIYYGERGTGKCSTINDLCYLSDSVTRLGSLNPGVLFGWGNLEVDVCAFDGEKIVNAKTTGFYKEPNPEAVCWELANGREIKGSPVHPVWVCKWKPGEEAWFGYLKLNEAKAAKADGYRVWVPMFGHPNFTKSTFERVAGVEITEAIGYTIGALVGDGSLNQQDGLRHFGFTNADEECIVKVRAGIEALGAVLSKQSAQYQFGIVKSSKLRELLRIGKVDCTSYHKRIPDFILSSPKSVLAAFLQGLFDTDGTVDCGQSCVSFTTTSLQLGEDVQNALMAFGILSVRRPKNSVSGRPTWNLFIMGEYAAKFGREIGFAIKRKQDRIKPLEATTNRNRYGYPDAIKEVIRKIVVARPLGPRTPWGEIKFKKYIRSKGSRWGEKRAVWILNKKFPWGMEIIQVESEDEARVIEAGLTAKRNALLGATLRDRAWHAKNRSTQQAFKYVPSPGKLEKFIAAHDCREQFKDFLISDIWIELKSVSGCTADLADICVPGPHSFLCSGAINHNSVGALHELVQYCYEEDNCLAYIILKEVGMGTEGGAWHKLIQDIVPQWVNGLGIICTDPKQDAQTKKPYIWISNRHGGWSMIMLTSLPVAKHVESKMRGREPQIIFVDEAQTLESDTYFTSLLMQLGRRKGQTKQSKIIFACNPEGPTHWLYLRFFVMPVNQETLEWDSRYAKYHIPISDNETNLPPNYFRDYVEPAVRNDPIAYARLIKGEWVDRPDGDTLFAGQFSEGIHIRGDAASSRGMLPVLPFPIILSYDLGAAHSCVTYEQIVPTLDRVYKLVIDELDFVGTYMPYRRLVPMIIDRMIYWDETMAFVFHWEHISDSSAFDQYRAKEGSFDHWDVEQISKEYVKEKGLPERYIIRMKPAPKGEHSIESRVRMVTDDLISSSLLLSATCPRAKDMFNRLTHDPENRLKPRKKSRYGHNFDALSYGFFYYQTSRRNIPGATANVRPMVYSIGGRS